MNSFLIYIFQVSVCQTGFYLLYRLAFSKHTFFQLNRVYLLSTTLLSFIIPILNIGVWDAGSSEYLFISPLLFISENQPALETQSFVAESYSGSWASLIMSSLFLIYISGFLFFFVKLLRGLWMVTSLIKQNNVVDRGSYKLITLKNDFPFFSFFNYIFINDKNTILSSKEFSHVLTHEIIHVRQRHTLDIFFMELISSICWFNPFVKGIKNEVRQIHEFIADQQVVSSTNDCDQYSRLILRLSANNHLIPFTHQFSKINTKNRIIMLNQSNHHAMKTLKYLIAIPMTFLLMSFFSFTEKSAVTNIGEENLNKEKLIIGDISWEGNTIYNDALLNKVLGFQKGDVYKEKLIEKKLAYNPNKPDISSLYMDFGYLFFNIDIDEEIIGNTINLTFKLYEGSTVVFDKIIIKGNTKVETQKVLKMIEFKKGDLFSRSKLIQSQKNIAESGFFKSDEVGIDPIPHPENKSVDIEFALIEL